MNPQMSMRRWLVAGDDKVSSVEIAIGAIKLCQLRVAGVQFARISHVTDSIDTNHFRSSAVVQVHSIVPDGRQQRMVNMPMAHG
jgi:hypothetical protein